MTPSGSDQVKVTYNVDGSVSQRTEQRGTVTAYSYDNLRRPQSLGWPRRPGVWVPKAQEACQETFPTSKMRQ